MTRKKSTVRERFRKFARKRFNYCQWCLATGIKLTIDHIIPVSRGGPETFHNFCLACKECNEGRGNAIGDRTRLYGPQDWQAIADLERIIHQVHPQIQVFQKLLAEGAVPSLTPASD